MINLDKLIDWKAAARHLKNKLFPGSNFKTVKKTKGYLIKKLMKFENIKEMSLQEFNEAITRIRYYERGHNSDILQYKAMLKRFNDPETFRKKVARITLGFFDPAETIN